MLHFRNLQHTSTETTDIKKVRKNYAGSGPSIFTDQTQTLYLWTSQVVLDLQKTADLYCMPIYHPFIHNHSISGWMIDWLAHSGTTGKTPLTDWLMNQSTRGSPLRWFTSPLNAEEGWTTLAVQSSEQTMSKPAIGRFYRQFPNKQSVSTNFIGPVGAWERCHKVQ